MTSSSVVVEDAITFLVQQHREISALLDEVDGTAGEARRDAFTALRRLLAVHETAEEAIVHPRARRVLDAGEQIAAWRLQEETVIKQMLTEIEGLEIDSTEFADGFAELRTAVASHMRSEEDEEFPLLADALDEAQLVRMRRLAQLAQAMGPTRPHPDVESATGNLLAGPFLAMIDRVRDALETDEHDAA